MSTSHRKQHDQKTNRSTKVNKKSNAKGKNDKIKEQKNKNKSPQNIQKEIL